MRNKIRNKVKKRKGEVIEADTRIASQVELHPDVRKPFQTTKALYRAIDIAENQIVELLDENERMEIEIIRLNKLLKG